jgi:hypothetical protein
MVLVTKNGLWSECGAEVKYCFHNENEKRKQMSEFQTASTEVTIEALPGLFENRRLTLPQLAHPWRARYAPSFIQVAANGYIDYPEFSRSYSGF